MKRFIVLLCLTSFASFGQYSVQEYKGILESDTSSVPTKINAIHSILDKEKSKLNDTVAVAYYRQLADLYDANKDVLTAIQYCDTILKKYPKIDFYLTKEVEEQQAMFNKDAGNAEEAFSTLLRILSEYEDRSDFGESAKLNKRIGILFMKLKNLKAAEYHLEESIEQARRVGDTETEGYSLMSYGNRFKNEKRFEEAEEKYKASILIAKRDNYKRLLAGNYNNYGSLFRMMKDQDQAMKYYKMAVSINKEIGNDKWLSYNYNNLGNIYDEKGQYQEALNYFLLSIRMKEKINDDRGRLFTILNIASVYSRMGNFKKAYAYQVEYTKLSDSIAVLDNADLTKKLAAEFQVDIREAKIVKLNMQDKLNRQELGAQDERISYQNFIGWVLGIGIFIIIIVALLLWRSVINRKNINSELVSKNIQIDEQHNEIIDSINYAKRIQNSILPGRERLTKLLKNHSILYKPKDIISGDFYICDETANGIYFGTVDCTGHGVPGAMVSLVASSHFNKMIHELNLVNPDAILNELNNVVPDALAVENEVINDGMDMALCYIDKDRKHLKFSGAHQNCWVLNRESANKGRIVNGASVVHKEGSFSIIELKGERQGIGKSTNKIHFTSQSIELLKGDTIIMSTDGFQDQFGGPDNKKFKIKEMRNLVLKNGSQSPEEIIDTLSKAITDWQGDYDQIDDICILVVQV
ncbi:MAG: serine phosphatase RsbU (regulator of sigma subunit) [Crocinitomicaceae bacterium]|jgi:serine phosphatase RsbU (regulator of sigma subunit)